MFKENRNWLMLLTLACIWGSSFILMKRGMHTMDGEAIFSDAQVAALRMTLAGFVLLPFAFKSLKKIKTWRHFLLLTIVGLSGNFFPAYLFTFAETGISSGYAGMLNSTTPIFALLIGLFVFNHKMTKIQVIGILIGTVGIVSLMLTGESLSMTGSWIHILAVVLATLLYAISLNTIRHTLQEFKALDITALAFMIVLTPAILSNIQLDTLHTFQTNPHAWEGFGYIAILSIVGTAMAVILFNHVIAATSTLFASSVTYFIPIVAVLIGLGFGERIGTGQIVSMFVILSGVFIANYYPQLQARLRTAK
jgi:drug/metabolite transporter (DMT)-like permease